MNKIVSFLSKRQRLLPYTVTQYHFSSWPPGVFNKRTDDFRIPFELLPEYLHVNELQGTHPGFLLQPRTVFN